MIITLCGFVGYASIREYISTSISVQMQEHQEAIISTAEHNTKLYLEKEISNRLLQFSKDMHAMQSDVEDKVTGIGNKTFSEIKDTQDKVSKAREDSSNMFSAALSNYSAIFDKIERINGDIEAKSEHLKNKIEGVDTRITSASSDIEGLRSYVSLVKNSISEDFNSKFVKFESDLSNITKQDKYYVSIAIPMQVLHSSNNIISGYEQEIRNIRSLLNELKISRTIIEPYTVEGGITADFVRPLKQWELYCGDDAMPLCQTIAVKLGLLFKPTMIDGSILGHSLVLGNEIVIRHPPS